MDTFCVECVREMSLDRRPSGRQVANIWIEARMLPEWDVEITKTFCKYLADPHTVTIAVVDDLGMAGFLMCTFKCEEGYIAYTAVLPRRQNKGCFSKMFDVCKEIAKSVDCKKLYLVVAPDNLQSISIYKHKGFNTYKHESVFYEMYYTL